jgi:hypothetical protein
MMNNPKMKSVAIAATAGVAAIMCVPAAHATSCAFGCIVANGVPEPATLGLLVLGIAGAAIARRRKR